MIDSSQTRWWWRKQIRLGRILSGKKQPIHSSIRQVLHRTYLHTVMRLFCSTATFRAEAFFETSPMAIAVCARPHTIQEEPLENQRTPPCRTPAVFIHSGVMRQEKESSPELSEPEALLFLLGYDGTSDTLDKLQEKLSLSIVPPPAFFALSWRHSTVSRFSHDSSLY